jgi:hypothetical protein
MASKPRKAFDGVGRPKGFIDDAAKAALKGVKIVAGKATFAGPRAVKGLTKSGIAKKDAKQFIYGGLSPKKMDKFYGKQPPKIKDLPSVKGKSPRPMPSKPNPRAQTTAQADMTQRKAERDWAKNKRKNYRG